VTEVVRLRRERLRALNLISYNFLDAAETSGCAVATLF